MPTLDFSDVIASPEFATTFSVKRRTDTVSEATGRSTLSETITDGIAGVVVFGNGDNKRREDAQMADRRITVITKYRLRAAGEGTQPDIVVYDGVDFTVTGVEPWHRFGSGFLKATAESMRASDPDFN